MKDHLSNLAVGVVALVLFVGLPIGIVIALMLWVGPMVVSWTLLGLAIVAMAYGIGWELNNH
jgi:hypothetical protein